MAKRWIYNLLTVSVVGLVGCADTAGMSSVPGGQNTTPTAGSRATGPEFETAPSFDSCYPWEPGRWEPPIFQLFNSGASFMHLTVMPNVVELGTTEDGWEATIDDVEFARLWELGVLARQRHRTGEDFTNGEPDSYLLSIGCGEPYSWHVRISEAIANANTEDPAARLAKELFALARNPPANAIR